MLAAIKNCWAAAPHDEFDEPRPPILIIDQFEEILTTHRNRWQDAQGFFEQLAEALEKIPRLGIVLAMREDFVAGLDPYAPLLPKRLKARFRMERLGYAGALEAIAKPAASAQAPFEAGVAEQLADELRRIKAVQFGGHDGETVLGPYVEPVQLQVVCSQLWSNLPEQADQQISQADVQQYGNVDQALIGFYESCIQHTAQEVRIPERTLRRWFAEKLITPMQTRGLVLRGEKDTAGLSNAAIDHFEAAHLIGSDVRAGARWYEISHDRLVDPMVRSNRAWEQARQTTLRLTAQQWKQTGQSGLLFIGPALRDAEAWIAAHPEDAEAEEIEFVQAGQQLERSRLRRRRLNTAALTVAALMIAVVGTLGFLAYKQSRIATSRAIAAISDRRLDQNREQAIILAQMAIKHDHTAEAEIALRQATLGYEPSAPLPDVTNSVYSVAYSPDGRYLLAGLSGSGVRMWDMQTRQIITPVWPIKGEVYGVAYRPDGQQAAITNGKNVVIVDAQGASIITLTGHTGIVFSVAYSPDARWLASGGGDGNAYVWDTTTWQAISLTNHLRSVRSVAFSPDGRSLATGSWDKTILVWPISTTAGLTLSIGQPLTLTGHTDLVESVAFSPDSRWLASGSDDRTVRVWNVTTGKEDMTLTGQSDAVRAVAFSADGQWLLSGGADSLVMIYAFGRRDPQYVERLTGATSLINSAAFSPDSRYVAAGSGDGSIHVWDRLSPASVPYKPLQGHTAPIYDVAYSPDGRYIASGAERGDGTVRLWDTTTSSEAVILPKTAGTARGLVFSPDGRFVVVGYGDGATRWWDLSANPITVTQVLTGHKPGYLINSVAFSRDGRYLATGSGDDTAIIWDVRSGRPIHRLVDHNGDVYSVAFSPDGRWLATASEDKTVGLWDMATGAPITRLLGHEGEVWSVAFSPDGKSLASGSWDATVRLWNLQTFTTTEVLLGHTGYVYDLAFSPDGKRLLTGSRDTSVRLWDLTTSPPRAVGILVCPYWPRAGGGLQPRLAKSLPRVRSIRPFDAIQPGLKMCSNWQTSWCRVS